MNKLVESILAAAIIALITMFLTVVYGARVSDMSLVQDALLIMFFVGIVASIAGLYLYKPKLTA